MCVYPELYFESQFRQFIDKHSQYSQKEEITVLQKTMSLTSYRNLGCVTLHYLEHLHISFIEQTTSNLLVYNTLHKGKVLLNK